MTYDEIMKVIEDKASIYKDKRSFYSTPEYMGLYAAAMRLYKSEGHEANRNRRIAAKKKFNKQMKQAQIKTGLPVGLFLMG
jgi:hypothetical protein